MSEKIVVPDGMLRATEAAYWENRTSHGFPKHIVVAALRWLVEEPSEITDEMWHQISGDGKAALVTRGMANDFISFVLRRMFLAPAPSVYEGLLDSAEATAPQDACRIDIFSRGGELLASRSIQWPSQKEGK